MLVFAMFAAVMISSAQILDDRDYKLTVDVELVQLLVSVVDKQGFPVRDLQRDSFTVYEDKAPQHISLFKQEDVPLSVVLVIDASGSMLDKLDRLKAAAKTFVRERHLEDQTSIVSFADEVFLEQDFTEQTGDLGQAFSRMPSNTGTAFYDAVYLAARHLHDEGSHEKKVLVVVSDGEDNKSKYDLGQVLRAVAEWKITVYSVGLLSSGPAIYGMQGDAGKKALKRLADLTGGAWFFPGNINEVEDICKRIARDLRNQYTIGYRPANEKRDGSWRKILVRITPPKNTPKLTIRTKQGYYAPRPRTETAQSMKELLK